MTNTTNLEIIIGTYEEFVIGYRLNLENQINNKLTQSFASHSHSSSVRCVANSEHYFASGGADDRIVIYDLKSRKEHCMLTHHNGTVNCLKFIGHTHLMSGGSDGILSIIRIGNWQVEKIWEKAHKGASIIDISVHSSNKFALTLGADCTLRTWNLIKGRQAYVINLNSKSKNPKSLQFIKWAPDGIRFVLCGSFNTDIWSIETGGIVKPIDHKNKVSYCLFYNDNNLIVAFENGHISVCDLENNKHKEIKAHSARIKAIDIFEKYLITCSSNGEVKVWNEELNVVATSNTGCRNTCMQIVLSTWIKKEEKEDPNEKSTVNNLPIVTIEHEDGISKSKTKKKSGTLEKPTVVVVEEEEIPKKKKKARIADSNGKTLKIEINSQSKTPRGIQSIGEDVPPKKKKRKLKNKI